MVSLTEVHSSNSLIASTFPPGLVAVFVGGTSGIGEVTLKTLSKYAKQPRVYFVGRSEGAADRISTECKELNPAGEYIFIKADVSLVRVVDEVCQEIKAKEKAVNILVLSSGAVIFDHSVTSEGLHVLASLNYYSRLRFITNLLPLIQAAPTVRRVVTVAGGTHEGPLDPTDFPALRVPIPEIRGHLTTLITLGLEAVAKTAPDVIFVHNYPGTVNTQLLRDMPAEMLKTAVFIPIEECGVSLGTNGEVGGGVYSVRSECDGLPATVLELLAGLRGEGMVRQVWQYTEEEYKRITKAC